MRRIRILSVMVAVMVAAACGSDASSDDDSTHGDSPNGPTAEPEGTASDLDVTMQAELGTGPPDLPGDPPDVEGLVADYTVTNNTDTPILVAQGRGDIDTRDVGQPIPGENTSWAYTADDGVIALTNELFAVNRPEGTEAAVAWTIPATRVAPSESTTGQVWALMPLVPVVPASDEFELPGSGDLNPDASSWRFCVQVAPDTRSDDTPVIDEHLSDRQLLCSENADLPPGVVEPGHPSR